MVTISASQAKQSFASVLELIAREPVVIQRHSRDVAVVLSMEEYRRLTRLNVEDFRRFCDRVSGAAKKRGLTTAKLARLLKE